MKKVFFALMMGLAVFACTPAEYDDTAIKEQIDNLDDRLTKVEEDLATLELNVAGMKTLAEALKNGKYVESVVALEDGTGYTITFSDDTTIVIKHGEKGATGEKGDTGATGATGEAGKTPTVTVKDVDGVFYWFINGEQGPAVYEEAPVFTSEDGNLYVTYPDGTKEYVGTLTGKSIFDSVVPNVEEGTVTFTFVGENGEAGDSFVLPLAEAFSLEIAASVGLSKDQTEVEIPYTVKGATETTVVDVLAVACEAVVEPEVIKVSKIAAGAQMLVFADNGEGKTSIKKVVFSGENYSVEAVDYVIPGDGGQVVVKGVSNVHFEVVIPAEATWLTQVVAKSAFELTFAADKNPGEERSAKVDFVRQGTEEVLMSVTISQPAAKPFAELVRAFQSHGADSWMAAFGGKANADRNMAMDGEYIYIAETQASPVLWKIAIADGKAEKMPVGTVDGGGTFALACPRIITNTDPGINGGKDVLAVCNMGQGEAVYLYLYANGIDKDPVKVSMHMDGLGRRIGDQFSVTGTLQNGNVWFKEQGSNAVMINQLPFTSENINKYAVDGIWPERVMLENTDAARGSLYFYPGADFTNALYTSTAISVFTTRDDATITAGKPTYMTSEWAKEIDYTGAHGFNFFKHKGENYIAYTSFSKQTLYIIKGASSALEMKSALEAHEVVFEAKVSASDNACTSGNSGSDCMVYTKDGVTYVAGHVQNVGVVVFKLN